MKSSMCAWRTAFSCAGAAVIMLMTTAGAQSGTVNSINVLKPTNQAAHRTDAFRITTLPRLMLRRAQDFTVKVRTSKPVPAGNVVITFFADPQFGGLASIPITSYLPPGQIPEGAWGCQTTGVVEVGNEYEFTVRVRIAKDAAVGAYRFRAVVGFDGPGQPARVQDFGQAVNILFNPWSALDSVYMGAAADRNEYVLNENGLMLQTPAPDHPGWNKEWGFAQFDEVTLKVALYALDTTPGLDRSSPVQVAREISGAMNWRYWSQGVLEGNWTGDFTGGREPWKWTGSRQVLRRYLLTAVPPYEPVRFGQCWVFGGTGTSLLRALGIPARPVTCSRTGIDNSAPVDGYLDDYLTWNPAAAAGAGAYVYDTVRSVDSSWNYHVWTEAWMKRPDVTAADGWQALDPTSQTIAGGLTKIGPAPVVKIRAAAAVPADAYNTDWMYASVRAGLRTFRNTPALPGVYAEVAADRAENGDTIIGNRIVTKSVGANAFTDLVGAYKPAPPRPGARSPGDVQFIRPPSVLPGNDATLSIVLNNPGGLSSREYRVTVIALLNAYNGETIGILANPDYPPVFVAPGGSEVVALTIPGSQTAGLAAGTMKEIVFKAVVYDPGSDEIWTGPDDGTPAELPGVGVNASPASVVVGAGGSTAVVYVNTTALTLTNVAVTFTAGPGLTFGGAEDVTIALGTLNPGQAAAVPAQAFTATAPGNWVVGAQVVSDQLGPVEASAAVTAGTCVGDFSGDGYVDDTDFVIFAEFYDLFGCPSEVCPADLDGNGQVDDDDFVIFAQAYDMFVCN